MRIPGGETYYALSFLFIFFLSHSLPLIFCLSPFHSAKQPVQLFLSFSVESKNGDLRLEGDDRPGVGLIKLFTSALASGHNKLECFSLLFSRLV